MMVLAEVTIVVVGLSLLVFMAVWPAIIAHYMYVHVYMLHAAPALVVAAMCIVHLSLLFACKSYFMVMRLLQLPIRWLLMPILVHVMRIRSIRLGEPTMYCRCPIAAQDDPVQVVLTSMISRRRRDFKRKRLHYEAAGTVCVSFHQDWFSLHDAFHLICAHEPHGCMRDRAEKLTAVTEDLLLMIMITNGTIDQYYDADGGLVAVSLSVRQGEVLHWFLYFSADTAKMSGIWHHALLTARCRATAAAGVAFMNAHLTKQEAKLMADCSAMSPMDFELSWLYPTNLFSDLPPAVRQVTCGWGRHKDAEARGLSDFAQPKAWASARVAMGSCRRRKLHIS